MKVFNECRSFKYVVTPEEDEMLVKDTKRYLDYKKHLLKLMVLCQRQN